MDSVAFCRSALAPWTVVLALISQDYSLQVLTAKLREHFGRTSNFKFSFFDRIVDSWNSFPFNVHHSGNIRKSSTVNFFFQVIIFLVFIISGFMCLCLSLIELKHIVTHGETLSMESPALLHFLQWLFSICFEHFLLTSSKCALQAINLWVRSDISTY